MADHTGSQNIDREPAAAALELGSALADRVQQLRKAHHLSLDALAKRSGLSKGTVVAIEQGKANPSIGVLCRLAVAFSRSVTELLADAPDDGVPERLARTTPVTLWTTARGSEATLLAATPGHTMFELWSWTIAPGDVHAAEGHTAGTSELLSVLRGTLRITVGADVLTLRAGEAARLVADQPHSYAAVGDEPVAFTMAVLERSSVDRGVPLHAEHGLFPR